MSKIKEMRDRAERYRHHAVLITDTQTRDGLMQLAKELEEKADHIEAQLRLQDRLE